MSFKHYHKPAATASARRRCAVCNEPVYSRAGIHPQCAVRQSEPSRMRPKPPAAGPDPVAAALPEPASVAG